MTHDELNNKDKSDNKNKGLRKEEKEEKRYRKEQEKLIRKDEKMQAKYRRKAAKKKRNHRSENLSITVKIWAFFMMFIGIVFILMWLLEVVFLQTLYPTFKTRQIEKLANSMEDIFLNNADYPDILTSMSLKNNVCLEILNDDYQEYISCDVLDGKCILHGNRVEAYILLNNLLTSKNGKVVMKTYDNKISSEVILYGVIVKDVDGEIDYLFVEAPLAPVDSFTDIIETQTLYIIAILLFVALFFSIYISRYISTPIKKLTKSAEQLAKGRYDTKFEGGGYREVDRLAETLTYAETEISKVEQMQRDLIANTSHDLRTPLTMMKAYAEMIRDISGDDKEKREKHLQIIIDETDRLTALVNDILDLSKLENGSQKLEMSEFDITEKMMVIYERYVGYQETKNFHIHFTPPDEECFVTCDESKIERVICNLINNAINYTAKTRDVFLRETIEEKYVLIEVEDTGDGIDKEKINKIFDKYYRSENHKRNTVGTGLGLSIVKAILDMHDYDFGVKSIVGNGSTFWFKIKR